MTKIHLATDQDNGQTRAEMKDFRDPLWIIYVSGPILSTNMIVCCDSPSPERYPRNPGNRWQSRLGWHGNPGRRADADDRNPPGPPYPKGRAQRVFHRLRHRPRSFQRPWGRIPEECVSRCDGKGVEKKKKKMNKSATTNLREGSFGEDTSRKQSSVWGREMQEGMI